VALLGEERCDVLAGLAAAAGEEDAHASIQPPAGGATPDPPADRGLVWCSEAFRGT
jgi:hypothetical protein